MRIFIITETLHTQKYTHKKHEKYDNMKHCQCFQSTNILTYAIAITKIKNQYSICYFPSQIQTKNLKFP